LHGLGGTEDTFLNRYNGLMKKLAEENGYILVAPLGYRINGGYGRQTRNLPDLQRRKILEFSEKDVMNVVGRMREEYKIDDKRLFLMGHSMGGTGTWTLGVKYAGMWAALAPIAPGYTPDEDVTDLSRLKEMPILVSHGSKDKTAPPELSRRTVAELKKLGINPEFLEIPSADHETIVPTVLPKIFEFFNRQNKPDRVAVNEQTSEISAYKPNDGEYRVATVEEIILHDEKRSKDVPIKIYYPANISEQFPVIIFSHGSGGSKDTYPELARYWASHGFIVILPTHADSIALRRRQGERVTRETAFGGQAVNPELWTSRPLDISLVIDRLAEIERLAPELKGRINSRKIGAGGHSFGAYTAQLIGGATIKLENKEKLVSFADIRVAAVLLLSAPGRDQKGLVTGSWDNFSTPLMNITGSNDRVSGAKGLNGERWLPDTKTESFKFSRPGDKYLVFIEGAYHGLGGISGQNTQFARTVGGPGNSRHISYVKTASLAFWDFYLKSDKQAKNYLESKKLEQFSKGEAVLSRR
jgi:dienelactone hydrolase